MNEHTRIQRKKDADHDAVPQLAQDTHAFMEPQFGFDLGQVQIQHSAPTLTLQPKLTVSQPGDPYEQEADRVADAVVNGGYAFVDSSSTTPSVQRDAADSPPPQSSGQLPPDAEFPPSDSGPSASEEMAEGLEAIGKAIQKTPAGKELKRKAEELGAELWSHLEGKVVVIVSGVAALGTLFAANRELPAAIPDIPLDWAVPGLKANLTYEGPLRKPTKVMLSLTLSFGGGGSDTGATSRQTSDPQAEEIRRFQQSIHYTPGTPEAREEAARQAADQQRAVSRALNPDLGDFARLGSPSAFGWHSENAEASQPNPFQLTPPTFGEDLGRPRLPRLVPELRLDEPFIMRKASGSTEAMAAPSVVQEVLQSGGQPLDDTTRAFMEPRFGRDFGHVRIHTDSTAARSAEAVSAHAYTVGSDVVFGAGQYRPGTDNGKRLIAHELAHVVQQGVGSSGQALMQRQEDLDGGLPPGGVPEDTSSTSQPINLPEITIYGNPTQSVNWTAQTPADRMRYVMDSLVNTYNFPVNGAAGLVGNLWAESKLLPNMIEAGTTNHPMRARDFANQKTDFTAQEIRDRDRKMHQGPRLPGVGLAQWTTAKRRAGLFQHVFQGQVQDLAILDSMDAQIDYLVTELQSNYPGIYNYLKQPAVTVEEASDEVVYRYEVPGAILQNKHKLPRTDPTVQQVFNLRRSYAYQALNAHASQP